MHRGRSINALLDEHGHMGLCFFLLQEMCAEKLEKPAEGDPELSESDCVFNFHRRVVQQNLRLRPAAVERLLDSCQTSGLLSFVLDGNQIQISMPILLNLLDRDSKRARHTRAKNAAPNGIDIDTDKEEDKDTELSAEGKKPSTPKQPKWVNPKTFEELKSQIPVDKYSHWTALYGDEEFIARELLKAFSYFVIDHPEKQSKSRSGWMQRLSSWLERSWEKKAKGSPATTKPQSLADYAKEVGT
jgi:hypothetical protein